MAGLVLLIVVVVASASVVGDNVLRRAPSESMEEQAVAQLTDAEPQTAGPGRAVLPSAARDLVARGRAAKMRFRVRRKVRPRRSRPGRPPLDEAEPPRRPARRRLGR